MTFPGRRVLAVIPGITFFYVLLVLPFMGENGQPRPENMMFWPVLAAIVLWLALYNSKLLDLRFIQSPPIVILIAYLLFAGASISWAYSPEYAFSRYILQLLAVIIIIVPYTLPIPTTATLPLLHLVCAMAVAVNALYVLLTPGSPIGHPGYFTHKQELGMLCGATIILASHELLHRGWRQVFALLVLCLTFWVIFQSQSKGSLALLFVSMSFAGITMIACKYLRTTPAFVLGAGVFGFFLASYIIRDPVGWIAYRLYGDSTITGRTLIWQFIDYQISQRSWLGWGFHSYWGVPNSPHNRAPGFIKDMISTHSGYLELRLDTGFLGYWIFLAFVYASMHYLDPVRRKDPVRAWALIWLSSYVIMLNLMESLWMQTVALWMLYLIVVGESLRAARAEYATVAPAENPVSARSNAKHSAWVRGVPVRRTHRVT